MMSPKRVVPVTSPKKKSAKKKKRPTKASEDYNEDSYGEEDYDDESEEEEEEEEEDEQFKPMPLDEEEPEPSQPAQTPLNDQKIAETSPTFSRALQLLAILAQKNPQFAIEGERNIWIIKPKSSSRGRGISLTRNLCEI